MKKLVNNPLEVTDEMVEGFVTAFPQYVRKLNGVNVVVSRDAPVLGKVGIITGGGSGHEPFWIGYTGRGMSDAVVVGAIFSSPPPKPVYAATKTVNGGAGVLYILGNYSGDKMNFGLAADEARAEGIKVNVTNVTDDVASAPRDRTSDRRGIAGNLFVIKIAGAKAEEMATLEEVTAIAQKANANLRTMGVALAPCTIPAAGKPHFILKEDEMEVGLGIHGEPGSQKTTLRSADEVTEMLADKILMDLPFSENDEVAVLVNGLGSTPLSELFIVFRRLNQILINLGMKVYKSYVGNYCTSLEMAGCSLTLLRLDAELKRLLDAPVLTPYLIQK